MRNDIRPLPDVEVLRDHLDYNPDTGVVVWRKIPTGFRRAKVGDEVGSVGSHGYLKIGIRRKQYYAHRIIWKIVTGDEPPAFIDHIDGNKLNNRWENFRLADNGQNIWNSKLRSDNRSGVKGVCWAATQKAWAATIGYGGEQIRLGYFKDIDDAIAARRQAEATYHGEFSRAA